MNDVSHTVEPPLTATSLQRSLSSVPKVDVVQSATVVFATSPESKLSYEALEPSILRAYFSVADANWKINFGFSELSSCLTEGR